MSCNCCSKDYVRRVTAAVARDEVRRLLRQDPLSVGIRIHERFEAQFRLKPKDFDLMTRGSEEFWFYRGEWRSASEMRTFKRQAAERVKAAFAAFAEAEQAERMFLAQDFPR